MPGKERIPPKEPSPATVETSALPFAASMLTRDAAFSSTSR